MITTLLSTYRPFIDPINAHSWWFLLLLPMAFFVSLAYKSVRVADLSHLLKNTLVMSVQIILAMIGLGFAFYMFVQYVLPHIVPRT